MKGGEKMMYSKKDTSFSVIKSPKGVENNKFKNKLNTYYEQAFIDAGDNVKSIVNKAVEDGAKEARTKKFLKKRLRDLLTTI